MSEAPETTYDTTGDPSLRMQRPREHTGGTRRRGGTRRLDWVIVAVITLLYAVLAFWNLGDLQAAQNGYETREADEQICFDFGSDITLSGMQFYSFSEKDALTAVTFEYSSDGTTWHVLAAKTASGKDPSYGYSSQFCWQDVTLLNTRLRYLRLTVPDLKTTFFELAFTEEGAGRVCPRKVTSSSPAAEEATLSSDGTAVGAGGLAGATAGTAGTGTAGAASDASGSAASAKTAAGATVSAEAASPANAQLSALFDEQDLVPARASFMNSTYFDEIYHARTSYEMLHGYTWYENTHPVLGKAIIEASIAVLGMTPFAWRLPGTVAGILMLPLIYLIGMQLFRRREPAVFATLVFALDCMHYAQTRIATIDSFTLLFILVLFYFLARYVMHERRFSEGQPLHGGELFCAGIAMGLACAVKWIGFYAAVGAAVILFAHWIRLGISARGSGAFFRYLAKTAGICVVAFLIVPFCIYFVSFAQLYTSPAAALGEFWRAQTTMLSYHTQLVDTHYFASPWYEWPLDIMPMWWYVSSDTSTASTINTMGNPIVWWAGLVAMVALVVYAVLAIVRRAGVRRQAREQAQAAQRAVARAMANRAQAAPMSAEQANAAPTREWEEAAAKVPRRSTTDAVPTATNAQVAAVPAMGETRPMAADAPATANAVVPALAAQRAFAQATASATRATTDAVPAEPRAWEVGAPAPAPAPAPASALASALAPAPAPAPARALPFSWRHPLPQPVVSAWIILVGYLSLYVPWMLVPRLTFIYHYFACTPFLAFALAFFVWRGIEATERNGRKRRALRIAAVAFLIVCALAFALFFPVISGLSVPPEYIELTKWLPKWVIWHA